MRNLTLRIEGMNCGHCLNAVRHALLSQRGVEVDSVQLGQAEIRYDESVTTPARVEAAVLDAGYRATHHSDSLLEP